MPSRRAFLAGAAAVAASRAPAQVSARPRNVLLMIADDLGLNLGCYGDSNAVTPQLDRLAGDGVRFTNAFCTTASCSPSRSVMYTGLHNHANGQYGLAHATHHFGLLPHVVPFTSLLEDAGYRTGVLAKMHVNPEERFRWDVTEPSSGRDVHKLAEGTRRFVAAAGASPWFLQIGFTDPHRAAKGFANREYPGVKPMPFDASKLKVPGFLPDLPAIRQDLADYYESVNRLDQGVGMIVDALRESKQLDNTLVVFLSDNGMPFPNAKTNLYDAAARLPLIVRSPDGPRGTTTDAMVAWTDLCPTVLDWTRAKAPPYELHGRSFLPLLGGGEGPDRVYLSHTFHEVTMYYPMRAIRTRQHKYIRNLASDLMYPFASDLWDGASWQAIRKLGPNARIGKRPVEAFLRRPAEELYDIHADPDEVNNLATSHPHKAVLEGFRRDLAEWRQRTQDPWLINERYP